MLGGSALAIYAWSGLGDNPNPRPASTKARLPYSSDELQIESTPLENGSRFPADGHNSPYGFLFATVLGIVFAGVGGGVIFLVLFANRVGIKTTSSGPGADIVIPLVFTPFGFLFVAAGIFAMMQGWLLMFGHSEIIVEGGRLRGASDSGRFGSGARSRSMDRWSCSCSRGWKRERASAPCNRFTRTTRMQHRIGRSAWQCWKCGNRMAARSPSRKVIHRRPCWRGRRWCNQRLRAVAARSLRG